MNTIQATILGIVQGLTEFLPVSSSGHLVLANYYFNLSNDGEHLALIVDLATNTGTFLAVLIALRNDVWQALSGFIRGLGSAEARKEDGWHMAILVIIGSIPTVIMALILKPIFETVNRPLIVSFGLIITGFIMWFAFKSGPKENVQDLTWQDALFGGVAQGIAIFPGISRMGSTVAAMLGRGSSAELAARFSFLMYLVASLGAAVLAIFEAQTADISTVPLIAMTIASFVVGYAAVMGLFVVVRRHWFKWFAPYLWAIAAITIARIMFFS